MHIIETETAPKILIDQLQDPSYLPTLEDLEWVFESQGWSRIHFDTNHMGHEILSQEYVAALSNYLAKRTIDLNRSKENPLIILETGAGNGRLSHFLRQMLSKKTPGRFSLIAVDNGSWNIPPRFPIQRLNNEEAIERYKPAIIITSWMPNGDDWTALYRTSPTVEEYLLIGETEGGHCGADATWGVRFGLRECEYTDLLREAGFTRITLNMSQYQVNAVHGIQQLHPSTTVSFRRIK